MRFRFVSFMAILATAGLVNGANIINATGPSPFGFGGAQVFVTARAQGLTYTNLMNQIGPGATAANQVALPVAISGLTMRSRRGHRSAGSRLRRGNIFSCWSQPTRSRRPCLRRDRAVRGWRRGLRSAFWVWETRRYHLLPYPPATSISLGTAEGPYRRRSRRL